ncbi:MAG: lipid-A-disaccharide synthase [Myxococcaceae bacterium]
MDVMVVTGEVSGDQHAADLVAAMKAQQPGLRFFGMGGQRLAEQGLEQLFDAKEISVMGIAEVVPKLRRILTVMNALAAAAAQRKPAVAVLVDIPDFNLRLAKRLKALGIKVAYYVSPTVWAWREGRVNQVRERVDRMLCILPFEEQFYRERGVDHALYVGSPVLEQMPPPAPPAHFQQRLGLDPKRTWVALLPGSRHSELKRILPTLAATGALLLERHPEASLVVPLAPGLSRVEVEAGFNVPVTIIDGRAPEILGAAHVAAVASGTATLEAGLMRCPMAAVYRVAELTYWVGKALVDAKHFSLVNLLLGRTVIPELLQRDFSPEATAAALEKLWSGPEREQCLAGLDEVRKVLGEKKAATTAAAEVLSLTSLR